MHKNSVFNATCESDVNFDYKLKSEMWEVPSITNNYYLYCLIIQQKENLPYTYKILSNIKEIVVYCAFMCVMIRSRLLV